MVYVEIYIKLSNCEESSGLLHRACRWNLMFLQSLLLNYKTIRCRNPELGRKNVFNESDRPKQKVCSTRDSLRGSKPGGGKNFHTRPDWPWGPSSLLYSRHRVSFPEVKRSGHGDDHPPHLAPRLKKELCYISNPPMDHPPHQAPSFKKELSYTLLPLWTNHPIKRRGLRKSSAISLLPLWTTHPIKRRGLRKSSAISLLPLWTVGFVTKTSRSPDTKLAILWCCDIRIIRTNSAHTSTSHFMISAVSKNNILMCLIIHLCFIHACLM